MIKTIKTLKNYCAIVLVVSAFTCFASAIAAQALTLDTGYNAGVTEAQVNNYVSAVQTDGKILVGGAFRFVNSANLNFLTRLNSNGTIDTAFNSAGTGPNADVLEIVVLSDGKILIAGSFTAYNGVSVGRIARLNSDGTLDTTFNVGGTGVISTGRVTSMIVLPDSKIMVAGQSLAGYNGTTINGLFRLNANGTLDTTFVSGFATVPANIEQIARQTDGKILIAGSFTGYGNVTKNGIVRISSNGAVDNTFNDFGTGVETNADVAGLGIQPDGKIMIGGDFNTYNSNFRPGIARLNSDGTIDTTFVTPSGFSTYFESFAFQPDGKIVAAGTANGLGSSLYFPVIRFNTDGTVDSTFAGTVSDNIGYHISLQSDGKIIATGFFSDYAEMAHNGIVRLNTNGSIDTSFNVNLTGYGLISAMVKQADGKIVVGGRFRKAGGVFSNNIARFNVDGTIDTTFNTGAGTQPETIFLNSSVNALAVQADGKILVGGIFSDFNQSGSFFGLTRLNTNGSVDPSFNFSGDLAFGVGGFVEDINVLANGQIMVAGRFFNNLFSQRDLLRLNTNGSIDNTFNSGGTAANGVIFRVLTQPDGKYIIVGSFTLYNGVTRNRIARVNADGTLDATFDSSTGANLSILDGIIQSDGKILVGGNFTTYNGTNINRIARVNPNGTLDTTFTVGTGANSTVFSLLPQPDNKILVGGAFTNFAGTTNNRLARLNVNGSIDNTLTSGFDSVLGSVNAMTLQTDGKLVLGGTFTNYGGSNPRNSLVRLKSAVNSAAKFIDFDGDGKTDISIFRPSLGQWWYLRSSDGANRAFSFGSSTDKIVPADYTGDGKTDIAAFTPSTGFWNVLRSEDSTFYGFPFGTSGDIAAPGDYDGDGRADAAVFRTSNSTWFISKSTGGTTIQQFGATGDKPVVADYDGDGKADLAIYRVALGQWWRLNSSDGTNRAFQFGTSTDKPIQGDYTGDGKADLAFFRPSTGEWFILRSEDSTFYGFPFGTNGDIPASGDYDGDGRFDASVFRPTNTTWYLNRSTSGVGIIGFGATGDQPVPNAFVP
jgi:uncharacterized delta-60 repeat protein